VVLFALFASPSVSDEDDELAERPSVVGELPKATVLRLLKEHLPDNVRLAPAARESVRKPLIAEK